MGEYVKSELDKLHEFAIVGDIRGIGLLWAVELMADPNAKKKFDPGIGIGSWIRDYCWENGMILRNNGDILVIAPALVISREAVDVMLNLMREAIEKAIEHFKL